MKAIPTNMLVEVTNKCNHACIFCPHQDMKNNFGEIDPLLLKRIMREAYDMGIRQIGLYTTGEMFLCREIETHIKNAKETGFTYIYSDTNGALANKENMRRVINAGLDSIKFSINAGTRETYKKIHGRDDFNKVMDNLRDCFDLRQELNADLKIMVSYIITSLNEPELPEFEKTIKPYVDKFEAVCVDIRRDIPDISPKTVSPSPPLPIPCPMVFNRVHITYDGHLTACCIDFNHELLLGDLKKHSLAEVWNGGAAKELRERHLSRNVIGTACEKCVKGDAKA